MEFMPTDSAWKKYFLGDLEEEIPEPEKVEEKDSDIGMDGL
jgi:hypothetical protein